MQSKITPLNSSKSMTAPMTMTMPLPIAEDKVAMHGSRGFSRLLLSAVDDHSCSSSTFPSPTNSIITGFSTATVATTTTVASKTIRKAPSTWSETQSTCTATTSVVHAPTAPTATATVPSSSTQQHVRIAAVPSSTDETYLMSKAASTTTMNARTMTSTASRTHQMRHSQPHQQHQHMQQQHMQHQHSRLQHPQQRQSRHSNHSTHPVHASSHDYSHSSHAPGRPSHSGQTANTGRVPPPAPQSRSGRSRRSRHAHYRHHRQHAKTSVVSVPLEKKIVYASPRIDNDDDNLFPSKQNNEDLHPSSNARWNSISQQAGDHKQDGSELNITRGMAPLALKAGVTPAVASRVRRLTLNLDPAEDILPEWMDVISAMFFDLEHITIVSGVTSSEQETVSARMRRLYLLYRFPHLISIDGTKVTQDERRLARPNDPNGERVERQEWVTSDSLLDVCSNDDDEDPADHADHANHRSQERDDDHERKNEREHDRAQGQYHSTTKHRRIIGNGSNVDRAYEDDANHAGDDYETIRFSQDMSSPTGASFDHHQCCNVFGDASLPDLNSYGSTTSLHHSSSSNDSNNNNSNRNNNKHEQIIASTNSSRSLSPMRPNNNNNTTNSSSNSSSNSSKGGNDRRNRDRNQNRGSSMSRPRGPSGASLSHRRHSISERGFMEKKIHGDALEVDLSGSVKTVRLETPRVVVPLIDLLEDGSESTAGASATDSERAAARRRTSRRSDNLTQDGHASMRSSSLDSPRSIRQSDTLEIVSVSSDCHEYSSPLCGISFGRFGCANRLTCGTRIKKGTGKSRRDNSSQGKKKGAPSSASRRGSTGNANSSSNGSRNNGKNRNQRQQRKMKPSSPIYQPNPARRTTLFAQHRLNQQQNLLSAAVTAGRQQLMNWTPPRSRDGSAISNNKKLSPSKSLTSPFPMQFRDRVSAVANGAAAPPNKRLSKDLRLTSSSSGGASGSGSGKGRSNSSSNKGSSSRVGTHLMKPAPFTRAVSFRGTTRAPGRENTAPIVVPASATSPAMETISTPIQLDRIVSSPPRIAVSPRSNSKRGDLPPPCPSNNQRRKSLAAAAMTAMSPLRSKKAKRMFRQRKNARATSVMNFDEDEDCDDEDSCDSRDDDLVDTDSEEDLIVEEGFSSRHDSFHIVGAMSEEASA